MRRWIPTNKLLLASLGVFSLVLGAAVYAETTESTRTTWINEAPLADGWPELTPIGVIQVKAYPETRAAIVIEDLPEDAGAAEDEAAPTPRRRANSSFMKLFRHIQSNDIEMTSPVEMVYEEVGLEDSETAPQQTSMAFLYRHTEQGRPGADGPVSVEDVPGRVYISIGVRGGYTDDNFVDNLAALDAWLVEHADAWEADGPPRYLGYNSPMIPSMMRYGEVQRPVKLVN